MGCNLRAHQFPNEKNNAGLGEDIYSSKWAGMGQANTCSAKKRLCYDSYFFGV